MNSPVSAYGEDRCSCHFVIANFAITRKSQWSKRQHVQHFLGGSNGGNLHGSTLTYPVELREASEMGLVLQRHGSDPGRTCERQGVRRAESFSTALSVIWACRQELQNLEQSIAGHGSLPAPIPIRAADGSLRISTPASAADPRRLCNEGRRFFSVEFHAHFRETRTKAGVREIYNSAFLPGSRRYGRLS